MPGSLPMHIAFTTVSGAPIIGWPASRRRCVRAPGLCSLARSPQPGDFRLVHPVADDRRGMALHHTCPAGGCRFAERLPARPGVRIAADRQVLERLLRHRFGLGFALGVLPAIDLEYYGWKARRADCRLALSFCLSPRTRCRITKRQVFGDNDA